MMTESGEELKLVGGWSATPIATLRGRTRRDERILDKVPTSPNPLGSGHRGISWN